MATKKKENNKKVTKKQPVVAQEEVRIIKPKNYVILSLIFILTFVLVILLRNWYISYHDYELSISVLKDKLNEVTIEEIDTYLAENLDAIIYIEVSEDENSREVAEGLLNIVKERNLTDRVVYLNISSVKDKEKFLNDFSQKYGIEEKIEYYPALVLFYEGKIETFASRTESQRLNIGNVEQLFDEYEL